MNYSKISQQAKNEETVVEDVVNKPDVEEIVITNQPVKLVQEVPGEVVNCDKLNVRKEANKESDPVCVINKNEEVTITIEDSTEDFYKIITATGIEGYCMKQFINVK